MEVRILHLFYDFMNLYGEYGNIKVLEKHLKGQGFTVKIDQKTFGDEFDFEDYDFIYMGSGTEKNQLVVLEELRPYQDRIRKAIKENKIFLFTGNSYEIMGKKIESKGKEIKGLGIFEYSVKRLEDRKTADIIYSSSLFQNPVVGFINKMGAVYHNLSPLFQVQFGIGENEQNKQEGVRQNCFFGTYVIGPLLVRNPEVLEYFVELIGKRKDPKFIYKEVQEENEKRAYQLVLEELTKRQESEKS